MENDALLEDLEHDAICRECIIEKYTHSMMILPVHWATAAGFYCAYFRMTQFLFYISYCSYCCISIHGSINLFPSHLFFAKPLLRAL